jgi:uncharacterized protein (TIGR03000 family)
MRRRTLSWVGVLAAVGTAFFLTPEHGNAHSGFPGHLSHRGYYNPHSYRSPYLYYPFRGGGYPWYSYQPYYGWYFPSSSIRPPEAELPKVERPKPDTTAHVTVKGPADAEIWFDDTKMMETGPVREFYSPPLARGRDYSYQVRLRWQQDGRTVTRTREVFVTAGSHVTVDFTNPERTEK